MKQRLILSSVNSKTSIYAFNSFNSIVDTIELLK